MTRSKLIFVAWALFTMGFVCLYVQTLTGVTTVTLGKIVIRVRSTLSVGVMKTSSGFRSEKLPWSALYDPNGRANRNKKLRWDKITWGNWRTSNDPDGTYLSVPLWLPHLLATLLIYPFYRHLRKYERAARQEFAEQQS